MVLGFFFCLAIRYKNIVKFTVVLDESGSPHFPAREQDRYFSVGLLVPQDPNFLRTKIIEARKGCPDERVKRRGFFHASEDVREARRFLMQQLQGHKFYFKMLLADKMAADEFHKVNKPRHFHRILVRELFKIGVSDRCREIELLVGLHKQTLRSPEVIQNIMEYHANLQILEAINFPYGSTVRTRIGGIKMVTPIEEPLMDIVDYLIWAHQRAELKDDEHAHLQLHVSMMRSGVGGAHRFPGIWRIFSFSSWSPNDPILRRKFLPFFEAPEESRILERLMTALAWSFDGAQENGTLNAARSLGLRIVNGDRSVETLLDFGNSLFEVLDTEGITLHVSEKEFCALKRGAAVCCWLCKKKGHKPPVEDWEKMLEEFFTRLTGQQTQISWS